MAKQVKQPTLFLSDSGHGRPVKPSLFKSTASTPSAVVEAAVRRFMSPDAKPIFQRHWEEAKRRLGPWQAGLTLRSFIERNTKEIELDPWVEASADRGRVVNPSSALLHNTGSDNPLTYDCLLVLCRIAPTTTSPTLLHVKSHTLISVGDDVVLFRKGNWFYTAFPPLPGHGKQLEEWEHVKCYTARFTMPFVDPDVRMVANQNHLAFEIEVAHA